jgi:hypothetical protein
VARGLVQKYLVSGTWFGTEVYLVSGTWFATEVYLVSGTWFGTEVSGKWHVVWYRSVSGKGTLFATSRLMINCVQFVQEVCLQPRLRCWRDENLVLLRA